MTPTEFEDLVGHPLADYRFQCHAASLALVRALGRGRVARGTRRGVGGQHSWVVLGEDCYDPKAEALDPTLWSYEGVEPYVWSGRQARHLYKPHGAGSIWAYGALPEPVARPIELAKDPGRAARAFLAIAAPHGLDYLGWEVLLHSPVEGWPAREVVTAAYRTPRLAAVTPIDVVGMLTHLNPSELYR